MASTVDKCEWCGQEFVGYGHTRKEAKQDAIYHSSTHAWICPANPANKEGQ